MNRERLHELRRLAGLPLREGSDQAVGAYLASLRNEIRRLENLASEIEMAWQAGDTKSLTALGVPMSDDAAASVQSGSYATIDAGGAGGADS